jgi:hypothetical protein
MCSSEERVLRVYSPPPPVFVSLYSVSVRAVPWREYPNTEVKRRKNRKKKIKRGSLSSSNKELSPSNWDFLNIV